MKIKEKVQKAKAWAKEHKALIGGAIGAAVTAVIGGGIAVKTLCDKHKECDGDATAGCFETQCQIDCCGKKVPAMLQIYNKDEAALFFDPKDLDENS